MRAYRLRIEFVWGHQSRIIGLSKTNPSYYYPPPTTILGALAEPLAKEYGLGENPTTTRMLLKTLSHNLLAIGIKPVNALPVKYMDINRIIAIGSRKKKKYPSPEDLGGSFDAPARGKTIMSPLRLDEPPIIDLVVLFKNNSISVNNIELDINDDVLWRIHRLGSKESIVSVIEVEQSNEIGVEQGLTVTGYSFPFTNSISVVEKISGRWAYEVYINPFQLTTEPLLYEYFSGKNLLTYMIPLKTSIYDDPLIKIRVNAPLIIYNVGFKAGQEKIIGVTPK
ncbi:MAG: type I-A CRISPR-associated protein Cas5 [Crenarchaeota archaeon]|nr:type I-A CRISPR-associated protein Cas5 [Thermoproteota archaeon]